MTDLPYRRVAQLSNGLWYWWWIDTYGDATTPLSEPFDTEAEAWKDAAGNETEKGSEE